MRAITKVIVNLHRYLGILLSLMFIIWFASAFVMIYAGGMPKVTPQMRVEGAAGVDFDRIAVGPGEASQVLGYDPTSLTLRSFLDRPVYDFSEPGYPAELVFADNGELYSGLTEEEGARIAGEFLGVPAQEFRLVELVNRVDQWTLTLRTQVPFYKYALDDAAGTEVYVSVPLAQVGVYTTTRSRALAWLGTVPHWLYFSALRLNQPLWYDLVVWLSGLGCVLAGMGLVLGVVKWRRTRPLQLGKSIPYRGLMRWHYVLGITFGIVTFTWVFSGLLSMEPFSWTNQEGLYVDATVYEQDELEPGTYPPIDYAALAAEVPGVIKEVQFRRILGTPYLNVNYSAERNDVVKRERLHQPYYIQGQADADSVLIDARTLRVKPGFDSRQLTSLLDESVTASVTDSEVLSDYDDYYYSRGSQLPLPVLRVKFDDPALSWVYIDPQNARLLSLIHRYSRVERWLYNGLHSLDFAFWYHKRPLWDIGVLLLLSGGLVASCLGFWLGVRRMVRDVRTAGKWLQTRMSGSRARVV